MRGIPRPKNKKKKKKEELLVTKAEKDKKSDKEQKGKPKEQGSANSQAQKGLPSRKQSQSHTQNYQNYTVSIAQKRRSQQEREALAQDRRPKVPPQNNLTYYNFTKPPFLNEQMQNPMVIFQDRNSLPPHMQQYLAAQQSKGIVNFSFQPTAPPDDTQKKSEEIVMKTNQFPPSNQLSHQQQWQLMQQQSS